MPGREPKNPRTRDPRGNPGKRAAPRTPHLTLGAPTMPADLDDIARGEWNRLVAEGLRAKVLTSVDRAIVLMATEAFSTWRLCEKALRVAGSLTYETESSDGSTIFKARPECAIGADAWRRYLTALKQLGLTPARRAKVETIDEPDEPASSTFFN